MSQENTKLCDISNTNNIDFISTPIAPLAASAETCDINAVLLNLVMKEQFSGSPNEDTASHLNTFVELCDMQKKKESCKSNSPKILNPATTYSPGPLPAKYHQR